jgi:hypothetical protein
MLVSAVVALVLAAPAAEPPKAADPWFGIPAPAPEYWPLHILASEDVQKELKITPEQLKKIDALKAELSARLQKAATLPIAKIRPYQDELGKWADKALAGVLTGEQLPRHRQITWQVLEYLGGVTGMASNPAFARAIGLSADQQKRAAKIDADHQAAYMKLAQTAGPLGNAPVPGADRLRANADAAALKLLSDAQKKAWNEQLGEPFKGNVYLIPGVPPFQAPGPKK